ncbi:MAG: hypothetical protein K2L48_00150 [Mycoplasmoidaceae bacterium]|nr:hypothetical protein [Mycoplasmoidaceae bacterium]
MVLDNIKTVVHSGIVTPVVSLPQDNVMVHVDNGSLLLPLIFAFTSFNALSAFV